jgi:DNA-binding transcriptional regulator LsrR (DeoR family)
MKVNTETLTRYLHRIHNHQGWIALNDVAENLKIDRATSRRFTNMAMEWGLVERQQLEDQPTEVRATKKLMALEPSGVRKVVDANSSSETPLL